ncbi:DMT family transporter [Fredinandcohnia sp. 179-A 10B2 NHS]|uniref:DMT family transporter n=1 Tax=Fredinandcohnia sp. 179-A 10B2 NHS TaxID=3235176 RepID=UPI0039A0908A
MLRLYSALLSLSLIWGLSFVFIKILLEAAGVWGTVFVRCIAGVVILLPILWLKRKEIVRPLPWKSLVIIGVLNAGLPWGLITLSETKITTSSASVLNATTPIWTGLLGYLLFSSKLSKGQWIGILTGFVGILVLMDFNIQTLFGESFFGVGTMLVATACYGFSTQYAKKKLGNIGVVALTTISLLVGAAVGVIGMIFTHPIQIEKLIEPKVLLVIIGLGCFGSGIAQLLYYFMVREGSPEFASTVTYIIPLSAILWGYVFFKEPITTQLIIGLFIILFGVFLSTRKVKSKDKVLLSQKV